jgi:hypothetical protein
MLQMRIRCSLCALPNQPAKHGRSGVHRCFITQISILSLCYPLTFRIAMHDRFAFSQPFCGKTKRYSSADWKFKNPLMLVGYKVAVSEATYWQHVVNCSNNQTFFVKLTHWKAPITKKRPLQRTDAYADKLTTHS